MQYKIKCESCQALAVNGYATHESGCHGAMTYRRRGRDYARWTVWSLDVWGNAREGFEVNDRQRAQTLMIPAEATDREIIQALKRAELLNPKCRFASFRLDGDDRLLMLDAAKTGEPIYQMERE